MRIEITLQEAMRESDAFFEQLQKHPSFTPFIIKREINKILEENY